MLECCGLIFWSHPQIHISRELVSNGVRLANRWMFVIGMRSGRRVLRDPNLKAPADISAYRLNHTTSRFPPVSNFDETIS